MLAMELIQQIIVNLLIILRFLPLKHVNADSQPQFFYSICANNVGNYTANSVYQQNLNNVISSIVAQSTTEGFFNSTTGLSPDTAYGTYYCRGDIDSEFCHNCIETAAQNIVQRCPNIREAIIWYLECTLRYANRPIFSLAEDFPPWFWNKSPENVSNPDQFEQVLSTTMDSLIKKAAYDNSSHGFATAEAVLPPPYRTLYNLVQCAPDILGFQCDRCLQSIYRDRAFCCGNQRSWTIIFRPSCQLRYDTVAFIKPPAPGHRHHKTGKGIGYYMIRVVLPAGLVILVTCGIVFYMIWSRGKKESVPPAPLPHTYRTDEFEKHSNSSNTLQLSLETIRSATNNFSIANKLGEGGFGAVYRGRLPDGREVAVKRLSEESRQGLKEFSNEVHLVARLQHRNLVRLQGFCWQGEEKLLIYEFVSNLSLDKFLFDPNKRKYLDWETRFKIIIGIARGLLYLHEDSRLKIIHRDLKSSNILLDDEMNAKIADFGLARLIKVDQTQANTSRIVGTYGYMAPEYVMTGVFSVKSDVYSFGVLLLEILSGQSNNLFHKSLGRDSLISHAWRLWNSGTIMELVDPSLGNNFSRVEVLRCFQVALFCVQEDASSRPTMESVVFMLNSDSSDSPSLSSGNTLDNNQAGGLSFFERQESNPHSTGSWYSKEQISDLYPR